MHHGLKRKSTGNHGRNLRPADGPVIVVLIIQLKEHPTIHMYVYIYACVCIQVCMDITFCIIVIKIQYVQVLVQLAAEIVIQ